MDPQSPTPESGMEGGALYVQSLPVEARASKFQQHQEAVRQDVMQKLQKLGVDVATDFSSSPRPPVVLLLFQSTGRVGDELPAALEDLDKNIKEHVKILAVIQDSANSHVGREALPPDFRPKHLLDLVVVPGTSRLKQSPQNDDALKQVATVVGVTASDSPTRGGLHWSFTLTIIALGLSVIAVFS